MELTAVVMNHKTFCVNNNNGVKTGVESKVKCATKWNIKKTRKVFFLKLRHRFKPVA